MKKLVVIPSDPIFAYEAKGTSSWLEEYFNPNKYFDEVYVLSPRENENRYIYGLNIIPVKSNRDYRNILKKINPVCVRAYGGYWATDYANYNKVSGVPIVSSVHDTSLRLMHEGLRFSDKYIVMSNVIKGILTEKKYATEEEVYVLGNRVDLNIFKKTQNKDFFCIQNIRKKFPLGKMILHVGRVSAEKKFETVVNSLKYLTTDFFIVHIGNGDFTAINSLINREKLVDRVFHISKVENNELCHWYNAADIICNPSEREGFGLVFIEAAACKVKIVTSNIAPMNEFLINDKQMNYLVDDYENPKKISEAILELLKNEGDNNDTLKLISNKFSKQVISNKEIQQYISIINQNKHKTSDYRKWKWSYILNKNKEYILKKLFKLPKKIWKKILSYL